MFRVDQPLAPTAIDPTIRSQTAYLDTSPGGPSLIRPVPRFINSAAPKNFAAENFRPLCET